MNYHIISYTLYNRPRESTAGLQAPLRLCRGAPMLYGCGSAWSLIPPPLPVVASPHGLRLRIGSWRVSIQSLWLPVDEVIHHHEVDHVAVQLAVEGGRAQLRIA